MHLDVLIHGCLSCSKGCHGNYRVLGDDSGMGPRSGFLTSITTSCKRAEAPHQENKAVFVLKGLEYLNALFQVLSKQRLQLLFIGSLTTRAARWFKAVISSPQLSQHMAMIYHICIPKKPQIIYLKLHHKNIFSMMIKICLELEIYGLAVWKLFFYRNFQNNGVSESLVYVSVLVS